MTTFYEIKVGGCKISVKLKKVTESTKIESSILLIQNFDFFLK